MSSSNNNEQHPLLPLIVAALSTQGVLANADEAGSGQSLEEIIVKGQLLENSSRAFTTQVFDSESLREMELTTVSDALKNISGVNVQEYGLPGVASSVVIRGFGGGGHGGDLGVVLNGIPLNEAMSHADGYVDLNVIVPLEVDDITVFKGPVSALYGNYNRGGLLKIDTRSNGNYRQFDISAGSDSLIDLQSALGMALGEHQQINLAVQHFQTDGFRPQSDADHSTIAASWRMDLRPDTEIALSGRWHSARSDNPGYMTEELYQNDPQGKQPEIQRDGADKDFGTFRVDLNHIISDELKVLTFAYGTKQDFTRWFTRPSRGQWRQREETYDRDIFGAGVSLNGQQHWHNIPLRWVAGVETFRESTYYEYYEDLIRRKRTGPAIADRKTSLNSLSAFAELQADWHPLFMPSIGFRYDSFDGKCKIEGTEYSTEPCDDLNDLDQLAPKIGLRSALLPTLEARLSYAEGFSLPNDWIKYQPEADNLDPVTFEQYEAGLNWQPVEALELDIAVYQLDSDGEVRTVAPGVYENYGETERKGIELSLNWQVLEQLSLSAVYGSADTEIKRNSDPALRGNEVGGVPEYTATVRTQWHFLPEWQIDIDWRKVGEYAINDSNNNYSDSYDFIDITLSYSPDSHWRIYAHVDNANDEEYASTELSIGGQSLYAPAPPRQFRIGLQADL
ncbi:MAG: TonB-dependent receptor [Parahaliea sp.]